MIKIEIKSDAENAMDDDNDIMIMMMKMMIMTMFVNDGGAANHNNAVDAMI